MDQAIWEQVLWGLFECVMIADITISMSHENLSLLLFKTFALPGRSILKDY